VLRHMFQLKICVKRALEVSRRRDVREFLVLIDYLVAQNRNVLKKLSLVS